MLHKTRFYIHSFHQYIDIHIQHKPQTVYLPCKLVLTQWQNFAANLSYNATTILCSAVLQYMLYNVVTILVMQQSFRVLMHLLQ